MKNILIILKHNLKSVMKSWFLLIIIFPIAINLFFTMFMNDSDGDAYDKNIIGVYTKDNGEIYEKIIPKDKFKNVININSPKEVKDMVRNEEISVGVIIDSDNILNSIKNNEENLIEVISSEDERNKELVLSTINSSISKVLSFGDSSEEIISNFEKYENEKYTFSNERSSLSEAVPYILMFGFFCMIFLSIAGKSLSPIIKERDMKIDKRILVSKVSKVQYMLGHILGCFLLLILQSLTLCCTFYLFNKDINVNFGWMIILSFVLSLVGISIALLIVSVSNNAEMYYIILSMVVTPVSLLSGGFLPIEFMPEIAGKIAMISPLTWVNSAFRGIIMNENALNISMNLLSAIAISIVFIMLFLLIESKRKNKAT
ncbi:ABC transporter permease [Clostridium sp. CCUG 7971]|uniref:ABC transporter permease n=1 Tax=Clostridium sp. CCUG 7971 TaxID=2811414 RepID=UPI001ABA56A6|nr:ABC transporter permease [Clostridium sp. CCUG 7971]MBO3443468.1 ABC transporter permease [Clostridium sp. CCUG 7971]